ncbi:Mor transcription activator family protein [Intestinibacter sp.]
MKEIEKDYIPEELEYLFDIVGEESFKKIVEYYGGSQIYIPKKECFERFERNKMIYKDACNGYTTRALSVKWQLSTSFIRRIVRNWEEDKKGNKK